MAFAKKPSSSKVNQDQALDSYLATLLDGAAAPDFSDHKEKKEKLVVVPIRSNDDDPITGGGTQASSAEASSVLTVEKVSAVSELPDQAKSKICESNNDAVHPWARKQFYARSFTVGGLTLASPRAEIIDTVEFPESLESLVNQPDWCLGLFCHKEREIIIVDTDRLIRKTDSVHKASQGQHGYHNIVVLKGGKLGFACNEIGEIRSIKPADVKWRANKEKRPWLIGMCSSLNLALVDLSRLPPVTANR